MAKATVHQCHTCGKDFKGKKQKANHYCSVECYRVYQRSPAFVSGRKAKLSGQCSNCESDVYGRNRSTRRDGTKADHIFCNRDCYEQYRAKLTEIREETTKTTCVGCGAVFSQASNVSNQKYCSEKCLRNHRRAKPRNCVSCDCWFTPVKYHYDRNRYSGCNSVTTCSEECRIDWIRNDESRKKKISEAFKGEKHPNWQGGPAAGKSRDYRGSGWHKLSEKVRKRDKYTCQDCGITQQEHGRKLEAHHKIPLNQFQGDSKKANRMSNLVALCKKCHTTAEWKWRQENDIQLTLGFGVDKTKKSRYPSDLTGIMFGDAEVTGRAENGKHNNTRWHIKCHKCGQDAVAYRSGLVSGKKVDCGAHRPDKITAKAKERRLTHGKHWHINGRTYNSAVEAAKSLNVCHATIRAWCEGRRLKSGIIGSPRKGCYTTPKSQKKAA